MTRIVKTAADLFAAMQVPGLSRVLIKECGYGYLQAVEREDGSGKSFNVTITLDGDQKTSTVYIRFN